jgi:uncharacterized membrane protein
MPARTLRIAQFANVVLFALVMGVFWGTWFSLSRSIASVTPETFLEIGRVITANVAGPMGLLMPAALLSSLLVAVLLARRGRGPALYLALAGLGLMAGALVVTLTVNVPIDREIVEWTATTLPPDWMAARDRWQLYHTIRTFASIGALGFAVASTLRWTGSPAR